MNPHDLLAADHENLRTQAKSLQEAVAKNAKELQDILRAFQEHTQKHFKREDAYYRILDSENRVEDRGLIHQLRNDHAAVIFALESLLIRLRKSGVTDDWQARFGNMMKVFLLHLTQEDQNLFPLGQKMLSPEELDTIRQHIENGE
jgi:hemerythrin